VYKILHNTYIKNSKECSNADVIISTFNIIKRHNLKQYNVQIATIMEHSVF